MRVVHNTNKDVRRVTLAYIWEFTSKFLETHEGHEVRAEVLRRILHLVFRTCMMENHCGTWLQLPSDGCVSVSPRVIL